MFMLLKHLNIYKVRISLFSWKFTQLFTWVIHDIIIENWFELIWKFSFEKPIQSDRGFDLLRVKGFLSKGFKYKQCIWEMFPRNITRGENETEIKKRTYKEYIIKLVIPTSNWIWNLLKNSRSLI